MDPFEMDKRALTAIAQQVFDSMTPARSPRAQGVHLAAALPARASGRTEPGRAWTVRLDDDGTVHATAADGTPVMGWVAVPWAVSEVLAPFENGTRRQPALAPVDDGGPMDALTQPLYPYLDDEQLEAAFEQDPQPLAALTAAIADLRRQWDTEAIPDYVEQAAARIRVTEPQVPVLDDHLNPSEQPWCSAASCGWVRTAAIVEAADPVWGRIHRSGYGRSSSWIPRAAAELLAEPDSDLADFLRYHLLDNEGPVDLITINGPEGPVYNLNSGGAHRTHLFRILGMPWIFATQTALITPLETAGSITDADRWQGLIDRGLLHGEVQRSTHTAALRINHCPAPWMIAKPEIAAAYNTAYEHAYPGALGRLGVPPHALADATSWESWLLTGTSAAAPDTGLARYLSLLSRAGRKAADQP
ncbi:hypothetical protein F7Q99_36545 [Streptomyces kaniharaensis]|uniref:Uncharacterized protein n=1 Tax=Streptomyces kaniharaensis TaxID=212423 RepID=A0A6N7L133_9ACTN|nr:hypothetical protein [Streptomyces kaniharaensis]MQS17552.1 hypothetical protein [Streptomyces kaniharaensis]